jgi:hypothetical protein
MMTKHEQIINLINAAILSMREARMMIDIEINEAMTKDSVDPIIQIFALLRDCNEKIKEVQKQANIIEDKTSRESIPDLFKLRKVKNITLEGIGRITIGRRWYCSFIDKVGGYDWLRKGGNGSLIVETVNAQTLGAFAHNLMDTKGKDMPTDLFKTTVIPYTSITKA